VNKAIYLTSAAAVSVFVIAAPAHGQAVPEVMEQIARAYPNAQVLVSAACAIGEEKTESVGLLIQAEALHALVAYRDKPGWKIAEVPRQIENSRGFDRNFLSDFQNRAGQFAGPFEIRCTSPRTDDDIAAKVSGEFVGDFAEKFGAEVRHLCFQASRPYNSWHCLSINPTTGRPETSFVQMRAD
jgi:hypothetical protein